MQHPANTQLPHHQTGALGFWLLVLAVLILAGFIGAAAAYWIFKNVDAHLVLSDQPAMVTIPDPMHAKGDVLNNLDISLNTKIHTQVPIDKTVRVPINDTLNLLATFNAKVPIKLGVDVNQVLPVDQVVHVDSIIHAKVLGSEIALPIRGDIPIKAKIPVHLKIPVDKKVRLKFTAPIKARIKQKLDIPLKTTIDANIPINANMSVPVKNALDARIHFPTDPTKLIINYADLDLPLRTLTLGLKDKNNVEDNTHTRHKDSQ